jgi:O-antigen ligase
LFGVGVGDVQLEFNKQYEINHTKLKKEHWLRAHNQLITIWLTIGVLGFIIILYILLEPFFNKNISYPTLIVMVTLIFGFLTQDILETQAGVTLFAVFYALLNNHQLYGKNR